MKNTDKSCGLKRCLQLADTPIVDTEYNHKYSRNTNENTDKSCGLKRCLQPADTPIVDTPRC